MATISKERKSYRRKVHNTDVHPHLLKKEDALKNILAGKAIFTIVDLNSRERFTFKIERPKDGNKSLVPGEKNVYVYDNNDYRNYLRFCKVLVGPDNWANYKYFGFLKVLGNDCEFKNPEAQTFKYTFKGYDREMKIGKDAPSISMFHLVLAHLRAGTLPDNYEIWNSGHCCRCGRPLTDDESIERGRGPICDNLMKK